MRLGYCAAIKIRAGVSLAGLTWVGGEDTNLIAFLPLFSHFRLYSLIKFHLYFAG